MVGNLTTFQQEHFGIKVRCVCGACNRGWMEELETVAKRLLSAMLRGADRKIGVVGQRIIATWAFKTFLMLREATIDKASDTPSSVPVDQYRHLFLEGEPPTTTHIWLAKYNGNFPSYFRVTTSGVLVVEDSNGIARGSGRLYGATLIAGNLAFQVTGHSFPEGNLQVKFGPPTEHIEWVIQIWPPPFTRRIAWPPTHSVDDAVLDDFAGAFRSLCERLSGQP
jgi:hypothetical protein